MSILSGYDRLAHEAIYIAKRGISFLGANAYMCLNGMYEKILGGTPPGSSAPLIFPHDHTFEHGGVPLPYNNLYTFDDGEDTFWQISIPIGGSVDTQYWLQRGGSTVVYSGNDDAAPSIVLYASEDIDEDNSNVSSNPCDAEGRMAVWIVTSDACTVSFQIYNRTTGSTSSKVTTSSISQIVWLSFTDIPLRGGVLNELDVVAETTVVGSGGTAIDIHDLCISETRATSMPASAGAQNYATAPKP